jgi:hypothetical protein
MVGHHVTYLGMIFYFSAKNNESIEKKSRVLTEFKSKTIFRSICFWGFICQFCLVATIKFLNSFLLRLLAFKYDIVNGIFTASIYERCN